MLTSGLTNAPLTKALLIYTIASSIALSLFDIKHLVVIYVSPHFWPYSQFWRALVWQVVGFTNSSEALFAAMLVYHLRVVERAWGKRKIAVSLSFIVSVPAAMRTICYGKQRSQAEWLHIHTTYANNDNCSLDLPAHHTPLHNSPPTNSPRPATPPSLPKQFQLPALRPNSHDLRAVGAVPRHHPIHIPLPHRLHIHILPHHNKHHRHHHQQRSLYRKYHIPIRP